MGVWTIFLALTPFIPSLRSFLWLTELSVWALFATHLGAWIAALVNVKAERIDDRTEQGIHFARIEEMEQRILDALEGRK